MMTITELRKKYHCHISNEIIRIARDKKNGEYPNADDELF